jgi:hypothetical protein
MERITRDNSAVCLIDHQVGLLTGVRDIPINELKHNVVGLAKAARILGIPTIVSTTAKDVFWGPTFPELVAVLDTNTYPIIDRMTRALLFKSARRFLLTRPWPLATRLMWRSMRQGCSTPATASSGRPEFNRPV